MLIVSQQNRMRLNLWKGVGQKMRVLLPRAARQCVDLPFGFLFFHLLAVVEIPFEVCGYRAAIRSLHDRNLLDTLNYIKLKFKVRAWPFKEANRICVLIGSRGPILDKIQKNSKYISFDREFDADYENRIFIYLKQLRLFYF